MCHNLPPDGATLFLPRAGGAVCRDLARQLVEDLGLAQHWADEAAAVRLPSLTASDALPVEWLA
eukprot:12014655-Alexandrium_andersonii.AAC.1